MKIALVFGGRSIDHDLSILTAFKVMENINKKKYDIVPIYISRDGKWLSGRELLDFEKVKNNNFSKVEEVFVSPNYGENNLYRNPRKKFYFKSRIANKIDLAFPVLHGSYGEDGSIQAIFEMMGIPYIGSNILSSALTMDKILIKKLLEANNLPILNSYWFYRSNWERTKRILPLDIEKEIFYPMLVKPATMGLRLGCLKIEDRNELREAIELVMQYDSKIIVEEFLDDFRVITCSVMGYEDKIEVSECGEICYKEHVGKIEEEAMESFIKREIEGEKTIPAKLSDKLRTKIQVLAKRVFTSLNMSGLINISFILDDMHNVYINEIRTLPYFLSSDLWEVSGYKIDELIDKLIELSIKNYRENKESIYTYRKNLLENIDLN